ncbi:MAG: ATP-binding protein [Betaproteobacteria bacterium]|nr:MAG: ATP-binding protein [Betaproteobacteria bacterium]
MNNIFEQIIGDFQERALAQPTRRDVPIPMLPGKVDTLIGMRRTGKSWRIYQAMNELLGAGSAKESVLYINFDDERLYPLTTRDLQRIPETFFRLYPENKRRRCHFFFDEIQNVTGWERFVRRLLDTENAQITLTGSSARLLSREIATTLRGRSLATEIFPFSFREALRHRGDDDTIVKRPGSARRALLANRLRSYLETGGFPEVQGVDAAYRLRILQEYVDVVILRDVVERHGIGNLAPLRYLIRHLLGSPACAFSINRFHNDLQSQGIACGKNSLHDYLAHLEDAYLVQSIHVDSRSVRQRQVNPRKVYPIDTGLALAFRHGPGMDRGRLLETLVFLDLRRRGMDISYFRSERGYEVDFLARRGLGKAVAIQVAETIADPNTRQRELRALEAAMAERRLSSGILVTLDEEGQIDAASGRVEVVPAWRWLLRAD